MGRDVFHLIRLLEAPSNLALNTAREGAARAALGSLFQCLTTLTVKDFFLISKLNLPSFSLKPSPLVLSLQAFVVPLQLSCRPLRVLEGCNKVSPEPSLLQAEQPQLSQPFLIAEVFQASNHLCGPPLAPLQQVRVFPVLRAPELDAGLQVGSQMKTVTRD